MKSPPLVLNRGMKLTFIAMLIVLVRIYCSVINNKNIEQYTFILDIAFEYNLNTINEWKGLITRLPIRWSEISFHFYQLKTAFLTKTISIDFMNIYIRVSYL